MTHQLIQEFHVALTGTQVGMTDAQKTSVSKILNMTIDANVDATVWAHHGDCIGADSDFHDLALEKSLKISIHPPLDPKKRANRKGDFFWLEKPYLKRNSEMVACCDLLLVAPKTAVEEIRSGTWATFRMGKKCKKPIIIVVPDGKIVYI